MTQLYKHTQRGYFLFAILAGSALITLGFTITLRSYLSLSLIAVCSILIACAIVFHSMTIEISDGVLTWKFGLGVIPNSVKLIDIENAKVVSNPWIYGLGIHLTPNGWLYNVGGFSAVEIKLKSGKQFRLGTDEPEELAKTIEQFTLPKHK